RKITITSPSWGSDCAAADQACGEVTRTSARTNRSRFIIQTSSSIRSDRGPLEVNESEKSLLPVHPFKCRVGGVKNHFLLPPPVLARIDRDVSGNYCSQHSPSNCAWSRGSNGRDSAYKADRDAPFSLYCGGASSP